MIAIQGYFVKNKFVSAENITIPDGKRAIVTILDEYADEVPNEVTLEAMHEIENMRNGKIPKHQQSVESLFKELNIHVDS